MVEQPVGSALEGDPGVQWMGQPLKVRGCTYGLKHRKDYLLWLPGGGEGVYGVQPKGPLHALQAEHSTRTGANACEGERPGEGVSPRVQCEGSKEQNPQGDGRSNSRGFLTSETEDELRWWEEEGRKLLAMWEEEVERWEEIEGEGGDSLAGVFDDMG